MSKSKTARLLGFVGALGGSAVLIGAAVHTTGAYFTDSKDGTINTSTGSVKVATPGGTTLNFDDLLPGQDKTQQVTYTNKGTDNEDIWFVLPDSPNSLSGEDGNTALGRYGHFQIDSNYGRLFRSYNLRSDATGADKNVCGVDGNGWGGSDYQPANADERPYPPLCGVPHAILLRSNLTPGDSGTATITFGFTKLLPNGDNKKFQEQSRKLLANYQIVATQPGVNPMDRNNR